MLKDGDQRLECVFGFHGEGELSVKWCEDLCWSWQCSTYSQGKEIIVSGSIFHWGGIVQGRQI